MSNIYFKSTLEEALKLKNEGNYLESANLFVKLSELVNTVTQKNQLLTQAAFLFQSKDDYEKAAFYYKQILETNLVSLSTLNNYALTLQKLKNYTESLELFFKALEIDNNNPSILFNIGITYYLFGDLNKSLDYYKQAIQISPNNIDYKSNLAILYQELEEYEKSESIYLEIINKSNESKYLTDLGVCYYHQGKYEKAKNIFEEVLKKEPFNTHAQWYKTFILYLQSEYDKGFTFINSVNFLENNFKDIYNSKPLWKGQDIEYKTLLIDCDGGLGDSIQFLRYVNSYIEKGSNIIIACQKELFNLLKESINCTIILKDEIPKTKYDFYTNILSFIYLFNFKEIPKPLNLNLKRDSKDIFEKNNIEIDKKKYNIGIVWASKSNTKTTLKRSLTLNDFNFLSEFESINIFSFQKGEAEKQLWLKNDNKIINLSPYINDMLDTANFILNMDLIITVDTAVAHLASSMNKKTFILLPFSPDWRWGLNSNTSNWYTSVTLYRKNELKSWKNTFNNLIIDLKKILQN